MPLVSEGRKEDVALGRFDEEDWTYVKKKQKKTQYETK